MDIATRVTAKSPDSIPEQAQRFNILINSQSGGASRIGEAKLKSLRDGTDLGIDNFCLVPSSEFNAKMEEFAAADIPLLVGGGDGTIARAAAIHMKLDKPFGILPMGTMNLLAKDLGVPSVMESENIFDLYLHTRVQSIDAGTVNGTPFLCCAAIGTIPEASIFRETNRHVPGIILVPRLTAYIMDQMDVANMRTLQILADDKEISLQAAALVISNNMFAKDAEADHKLAKDSLRSGTLGIYSAAPQSLFERVRLLLNLQAGKIETEPSVHEMQAVNVFVKTENDEELVSVDGEPMKFKTPLSFHIVNNALKIVTPCAPPTEEAVSS